MPSPSHIIALAVSGLALQSCGCPDSDFTDETSTHSLLLVEEGTAVQLNYDTVDLDDEEGCASLCTSLLARYNDIVETVSSCTITPDDEPADSVEDGTVLEVDDETATLTCVTSGFTECAGGRHSAVLTQRASGSGVDEVGAWLSREAAGEAGSVHAFAHLRRELQVLGAPQHLLDAAEAAEADEVRHARMVGRLARARGGTVQPVETQPLPTRSLQALALENAIEGCVHETWAAAQVAWQARHAPDPALREVCGVLATDEARHADLAAAIHQWALSVLSPAQAAEVEESRQRAWANLQAQRPGPSPAARATLGLPSGSQQDALISTLRGHLAA